MIKRIAFAVRRAGAAPGAFADRWREAVAAAGAAPPTARPLRLAVGFALPEVVADPRHDAVGIEWFEDADHLRRFEAWLGSEPGDAVGRMRAAATDPDRSPVVVADEVPLRGGDWLARRWAEGGRKVKHMAVARRAPGLTAAAFSERWKARAGTVGRPGAAGAVAIPEAARGLAYVQNHPLAGAGGGPAYDAVNEVWFDDEDALAARVEWFARQPADAEDDLVGDHWFLAVDEEPLAVDPEARSE